MSKKILTIFFVFNLIFAGLAGYFGAYFFNFENKNTEKKADDKSEVIRVEEESVVIDTVEQTSPAVVSIVVTKDLPVLERYYEDDFFGFPMPRYRQKGTESQEVGWGSGFLVSADGFLVTNKHVVEDEDAEYTVLLNDERRFEAEVLARDPVNDLAILKIEGEDLPFLEMGDSSALKVGQKVIAIGNSLGEYSNTVSTGIISGLARSLVAGGGSEVSRLNGAIQTDASINPGNSGGPLLNLAGQVIGINTAVAARAENIGFAIPVNDIKSAVESVEETGKISRPWLGVRYLLLNEEISERNSFDMNYGALIIRGEERTDLAVVPGSPADKAGLRENDIILEVEDEQINTENSLSQVLSEYKPGDKIELKIMRQGEEEEIEIELGERN